MSKSIFRAGQFLLFFLFLSGCNNWSQVEKLQAEVEAIHDVPMMQIGELENLQNSAGKLLATADPTKKAELGKFISEAQAAHDAMFDWMNQYRAPEKSMGQQAAIDYLNKQKTSANNMSDQVLSAIEHGKKLLTDK